MRAKGTEVEVWGEGEGEGEDEDEDFEPFNVLVASLEASGESVVQLLRRCRCCFPRLVSSLTSFFRYFHEDVPEGTTDIKRTTRMWRLPRRSRPCFPSPNSSSRQPDRISEEISFRQRFLPSLSPSLHHLGTLACCSSCISSSGPHSRYPLLCPSLTLDSLVCSKLNAFPGISSCASKLETAVKISPLLRFHLSDENRSSVTVKLELGISIHVLSSSSYPSFVKFLYFLLHAHLLCFILGLSSRCSLLFSPSRVG
eukprot:768026-Hanusia_phi.AAC.5